MCSCRLSIIDALNLSKSRRPWTPIMITHLLQQGLFSAWLFCFTPGCFGSDFTSFFQNSILKGKTQSVYQNSCSGYMLLDGLIEDLILIFLWPDLPKGVLYMHSFKTHFSSLFVSYINGSTAHVFNTAEGVTTFFHSGLFLKPIWHPQVLGWHSNGPIFPWQADSRLWFTTRLADKFGHGFSYFVWHLEVKMAPMEVIWLFLVKT